MTSQKIKKLGIVVLLFLLLFFYKCPFQTITGIPCPGCNMTTSLYYLLHTDIKRSFYYHALLIPTMLIFLACVYFRKNEKIIKILLIIWCILMIAYYIYRMIMYFPNSPMVYDKNSLIYFIFRHV
ncbi:DUF2752 domain-containing protein [Holdemanella biformis]|uniref:DUF2752 domain-containing protein n=1 Tax=Holdemanella biformis TaxID=1735 RepID=UPI001C27C91A|nr:DUF2752 domain-containing protein [Holdemanella biformis]